MSKFAAERLGFLGGTFDPPHLGHFWIAQDALEGLDLDCVTFLPVPRNPLGKDVPMASFEHRVAMLERATAGKAHFTVETWEADLSPPHYTINSVKMLTERFPGAEIFWILGADQAERLADWHAIEDLAPLIRFIAVSRPGFTLNPPDIRGLRILPVEGHSCGISSTELRQRARNGLPIDTFLSSGVMAYIEAHALYS